METPEYEEEPRRPASHDDSWLTQYYSDSGVVGALVGWFLLVFSGLIGGTFLIAYGWSTTNLGMWSFGIVLIIVGSLATFPLRVLLKDHYGDSHPLKDTTYRGPIYHSRTGKYSPRKPGPR